MSSSVSTFNGIFIQIEIPISHTHIVAVQEENHLHKTNNACGTTVAQANKASERKFKTDV